MKTFFSMAVATAFILGVGFLGFFTVLKIAEVWNQRVQEIERQIGYQMPS